MEDLTVRVGVNALGFDKAMSNIGSKVSHLSVTIAKWGATAVAAGITASAYMGMKFERALMETATVANAFGKDLEALEGKARELGRTTAFTATEAANAMYDLASAGLKTKEVLQASNDSMKLAGATNSSMAQATQLVASTIRQFNIDAGESKRIVDTFASAITESLFTMESLTEAMKYAGTTGASLGWSLEQTTAAAAQFADLGLEGSMAGTNLRMSMLSLMGQTDKSREALRRMNLTFQDINPEAHSFGEILLTLGKAGMTSLDAMDLFTERSAMNMKQLSELAAQGVTDFDAMVESYNRGQMGMGRASEMYERMMNTTWGRFKIMLSALQELALSVSDTFKNELKDSFDIATKDIEEFTKEINKGSDGLNHFAEIAASVFQMVSNKAREYLTGVVGILSDIGGVLNRIDDYTTLGKISGGINIFDFSGNKEKLAIIEKLKNQEQVYEEDLELTNKILEENSKEQKKNALAFTEASKIKVSAMQQVMDIQQKVHELEMTAGKTGIAAIKAKYQLEREEIDKVIKKARDESFEAIAQANPKASIAELKVMGASLDKELGVLKGQYISALIKNESLEINEAGKQMAEETKRTIQELANTAIKESDFALDKIKDALDETDKQLKEIEKIIDARQRAGDFLVQHAQGMRVSGKSGIELLQAEGQNEIENIRKRYDAEIALAQENTNSLALVQDLKLAKTQAINTSIIQSEKAVAEARKQTAMDALNTTVDSFRAIAEAGGKYSKQAFVMYKAFAITKALMDTYEAAIGAYKALVGIPYVGPFIAPVAAAAAVAAGMAQVNMIRSQKMPSYDQGGISTKKGIYQTGNIDEAHIPLKDGKVPVSLRSANYSASQGKTANIYYIMENPTFMDQNTLFNTQATIATAVSKRVVKEIGSNIIINDYNADKQIRKVLRSGK